MACAGARFESIALYPYLRDTYRLPCRDPHPLLRVCLACRVTCLFFFHRKEEDEEEKNGAGIGPRALFPSDYLSTHLSVFGHKVLASMVSHPPSLPPSRDAARTYIISTYRRLPARYLRASPSKRIAE